MCEATTNLLSIPSLLHKPFFPLRIRKSILIKIVVIATCNLFVACGCLIAQKNIVKVEYFLDNDPGWGNATNLSITAATDLDNLNIPINPANLTSGVHRLYVRGKDADGNWSLTNSWLFYKIQNTVNPTPANIVRIEYYLDNDPGFGSANALSNAGGADISELLIPINSAALTTGVHRLYLRTKDANGNWSLTNSWLFYKPYSTDSPALEKVNRLEYYLDNDPGQGNATALNFTDAADISDLIIPINTASLTKGVHRLYVRGKDASGTWSLTNSWLFYKPTNLTDTLPASIDYLEYYVDTDPGLGNAVNIPVTPALDIANTIMNINVERLSPCGHVLYIRARDAAGNWSLINTYKFTNENFEVTATPKDFMVQFDGKDDYLDLGTWFQAPQFTVSFWVNPDSVQASGATIAALQNDLYLYANPEVKDNYVLSHLLQFDLLPNKWNHITITVDGTTHTRKVYLFGHLIDTNEWLYSPTNGFRLKFGNGGFFPNSYFKGQLDEIKLWSGVLSQDQIYLNVDKRLAGSEAGLLGYWNFNNGCSVEANDLTPNQRTGNLVNGLAKLPSTVPSIGQQIVPNRGGNAGAITLKIYDDLFQQGAVGKMARDGFADIVADTVVVSDDGSIATCIFNLSGKDTGKYSVVINNPDSTVKNYKNSFAIEPINDSGVITVQLLGRNVFRPGRIHKFLIVYQNTSNLDVLAPPFVLNSYNHEAIALSKEDLIYKWQHLPILLGNKVANDIFGQFSSSDSVLSPGAIYTIPVYVLDSTGIGGLGGGGIAQASVSCNDLSQYVLKGVYPNRTDFNEVNGQAVLPFGQFDTRNNGHNYIDGCSNPQVLVDLINIPLPSLPLVGTHVYQNWNDVFFPACATHDLCYQTCYQRIPDLGNSPNWIAKEICDNNFYNEMLSICESYEGDKEDCKKAAMAYFKGVRLFGGLAFKENQSYCSGGTDIDKPLPHDRIDPTYAVPDCNKCPEGSLCFAKKRIRSYDPNEKIGPPTFQTTKSYFNYLINFENKETATAPAQEVTVIDTLDKEKFDINTFKFGLFGFADTVGQVTNQYSTKFSHNIDLRPTKNMIVKVEGRVDTTDGIAYWKFYSIDPATMQLTENPEDGFLPPADSLSNRGEGWVSYSIKPHPWLESGSPIKNRAIIIFDNNAPIITNNYENVIDNIPPTSHVLPLRPTQTDSNFVVRWTGKDSISGIKSWDVYASDNLSGYKLWKSKTSDSLGVFAGQLGHTYQFYSIGIDSANNQEATKTKFEAKTLVTLSIVDSVCIGDNVRIASGKSLAGNSYRWQVNTGAGFQDVVNNSIYSNSNKDTLFLAIPPSSFTGYKYRCIVTNAGISDTTIVKELYFINVWTGAVSTAWENKANWECNVLPDENTDVIIPSTVANFPLLSSNASCKSVSANAGAALSIKTGFKLDVKGKKK